MAHWTPGFEALKAVLSNLLEFFPLKGGGQVGRCLLRPFLEAFADNTIFRQTEYLFGKDPVTSLANPIGILEIDGIGNGVHQGVHQFQETAQFFLGLLPAGLVLLVSSFPLMDLRVGFSQGMPELLDFQVPAPELI